MMVEQSVGQILVNSRTIDIAGDVLAIRSVTRLKVFEYHDNPGFSPGRRAIVVFSLAVAMLGLFVIGQFPGGSEIAGFWVFLGLGTALGVAIYSAYGPMRKILAIELSSGGIFALSGSSLKSLNELKSNIVAVIENPPSMLQSLPTYNVYKFDFRQSSGVQVGNSNSQTNFRI